ncbi:Dyp-type peroxidase [Stackebrandtia nassauensis]|uniref:Dyp-type peroxidase family n=1 Tax=Stackebrandtia nassauensis (strain DSM 44728 / CIP 108903 / NRRL B-16338 / NBRC 102104 / LLR-40K-21) TaxID=446470 RepID=D3Q1Y9_STANL|nr:Dyp-type peroxidase [Stackebrandtia nassauensis]ADD41856.1 Dyp-type peroxidase family [Stackebrandtia nassauensis DSM 44728]
MPEEEPTTSPALPRRKVFTSLAATAAVAGTAGVFAGQALAQPAVAGPEPTVPFHGEHQPGIAMPQQKHAVFVAFQLLPKDMRTGKELTEKQVAAKLAALLEDWTATAEALMRGADPQPLASHTKSHFATEAIAEGLNPARLTITLGMGPWAFRMAGLADRAPRHLTELPDFPGDQLNPGWSGGDLLLQICGDDPQVISEAFLSMRARVMGTCQLKWTQQGFLSTPKGATPRNLMGHKDGTANPGFDSPEFAETVWSKKDEPEWFSGGSYLIFRKIRMRLPEWSLATADKQNRSIGRHRDTGAGLGAETETAELDLDAKDGKGKPVIPIDAHVRRVKDVPMFRRSFNYDYGFLTQKELQQDDHATGTDGHSHDKHPYDAGLLFTAYVADPANFIEAQDKMSESDALNEFVINTGSAIFAVPPGVSEGQSWARGLFG